MDWASLGHLGIALCFLLGALGSALGVGTAGIAAAGSWAKDARAGKALRFNYIIFIGAPISQTFYAMIVMNSLAGKLSVAGAAPMLMFGIGLATGVGQLFSSWFQGLVGAAACRTLSESDGKGMAFLLIAIGIAETVGIFTMVFMLMLAGKMPTA